MRVPMDKNQPDSNMRRLKRVLTDRGLLYTLETETERARDNLLCNYCAAKVASPGFSACEVYSDLMEIQENTGAVAMVRSCKAYQPILVFRPPMVGLDGQFNTFRLGSAWFNRLLPGVIVGLVNASDNKVFGRARVLSVIDGDFDKMCEEHAYKNHMLLGKSREVAAKEMTKILRQAYGKIFALQTNQKATVIYLERLNGEDSPS